MVTPPVSCIHRVSLNLTRNERAPSGRQKYLCHGEYFCYDCGKNSRPNAGSNAYPDTFRQQVLASCHARGSLHALSTL